MHRRTIGLIAGLAVSVLVIPILLVALFPAAVRALKGVELQDTRYEEIHFRNPQANLDLAGMLFMPDGEGPFPAVVIIHGAGSSHRNNPWYLTLATYLQQHGIAVLLPDKRGSESSQGDWHAAPFDELATDTLAAIAYLRRQHSTAISAIGVLGASQGGQVVPIIAGQSHAVAFAINVVGSVVPFYDALQFEENHNLRQAGIVPGVSDALAYLSSFYIRTVRQKEFWRAIGNYDPLPYWGAVSVPALAVFGAEDTNTPTRASAARLASLAKPNIDIVIFEGSGHPLEDPPGTGDSLFRADALGRIVEFIVAASERG